MLAVAGAIHLNQRRVRIAYEDLLAVPGAPVQPDGAQVFSANVARDLSVNPVLRHVRASGG